MSTTNNSGNTLRKITVSAIFLAMSVVLSLLTSFDLPVLGESGIKVGFSGIFSAFPAILFGPFYGGAVTGLSDLFRALIKPSGAFNPLFTITAFIGGFLRGLIWQLLKNRKTTPLRYTTLALSGAVGILGALNIFLLKADGITPLFFEAADISVLELSDYSFIGRLILSRCLIAKNPGGNLGAYITSATTALILFSAVMLVMLLADFIISRKTKSESYRDMGLKISISMVLSGLVQTTINTYILQQMIYPSWKQLGFLVVLAPRAVEEVVVRIIQTVVIALLYDIFVKQIKNKTFMKNM